ncbi:hypothetical protein E4P41_16945 [Geodermatophilus sp. DF01-2]|uniref:hypothetical protein n=1 Tax=Geodermatophilus sp. DF01-2 TaxID=2559610 RepID=UPI0010736A1B|nr:hypothetical protein [Geodermatophilus sp. DF01_2]TFV55616.1 hypothetical protein E4P41_16945 [Geodermatophilus sp. DF01_2]
MNASIRHPDVRIPSTNSVILPALRTVESTHCSAAGGYIPSEAIDPEVLEAASRSEAGQKALSSATDPEQRPDERCKEEQRHDRQRPQHEIVVVVQTSCRRREHGRSDAQTAADRSDHGRFRPWRRTRVRHDCGSASGGSNPVRMA